MSIRIPKFNVDQQISKAGFIMIVGQKGTKTEEMMVKLLLQNRFEDDEMHLFTVDPELDSPLVKRHESISELDEVIRAWSMKKNEDRKKKVTWEQSKSMVIILDRFFGKCDFNDKSIRHLAMNSFCSNIRIIVTTNDLKDLPPVVRQNSRQCIFLKEANENYLEEIWEKYFNKLSFKMFHKILDQTTANDCGLLIETVPDRLITDRMFKIDLNE